MDEMTRSVASSLVSGLVIYTLIASCLIALENVLELGP